jgi:choline kinase
MRGIVLAAGAGSRLGSLTDAVPKAMLPVRGDATILDLTLANFAAVGVDHVVVVVGYRAEVIEARVPSWESAHGLPVSLVHNDLALERNNCYSLWLAREYFDGPVVLANGDTVHPVSVEQGLLSSGSGAGLTLALDDRKKLAEEEMKVLLDEGQLLRRISKAIDPTEAHGEYIGVSYLRGTDSERLVRALEETWRRDSSLYYEDGFQTYVGLGGSIAVLPIGDVEWVEVDTRADLELARDIACRF